MMEYVVSGGNARVTSATRVLKEIGVYYHAEQKKKKASKVKETLQCTHYKKKPVKQIHIPRGCPRWTYLKRIMSTCR